MLEFWPCFPVVPANASGQPIGQGVPFLEAVATEPSACTRVTETRGQDTASEFVPLPTAETLSRAAAALRVAPGHNVPGLSRLLGWLSLVN